MDFSSHLLERVRSLADPQTQSLLKFCQLAIAVAVKGMLKGKFSFRRSWRSHLSVLFRFSSAREVQRILLCRQLRLHSGLQWSIKVNLGGAIRT
jgi:hypothetical protein